MHSTTIVIVLAWFLVGPAGAQDEAPLPAATEVATGDEVGGETPRGAVRAFLLAARAGDWERAATYLELPDVSPQRARVLARRLKVVLDRTLWIDVDTLSRAPEGNLHDGLPPERERVGTIASRRGPADVLLVRVRPPDAAARWKLAAATVARVPDLYGEFGYGPLADMLPPFFFELRLFEIQLWQWSGLLVLVIVAGGLSWVVTMAAVRSAAIALRTAAADGGVAVAATGPLRLLVALLVFSAGSHVLALTVPAQAFIHGTVKVLAIVAVTWAVLRAADALSRSVERRFVARGQGVAVSVVPLGRRSVKVLLVTLAVIAMLQNFGVNVTGLLAGLGIGGLAVALAAQKTVENLFGGITLIADQPVRVGDFCRFGDRVGTVEEVGLRSTRVRTLDRTVVSIPNGQFAALQLENFARRDRIWLQATIGLRYETTPDQLRWVLVELKRLLLAHPRISPDPARVRFVGFGSYSLDLELFAYVLTSDINEFLAVREDLFLRIMDVVAASGTGFAFPSQTIYARSDAGLDDTRRRAAEEQVCRWRAERTLCLPDVPAEVAAAIDDTLDYPPAGSAARG